VRVSPMGRWTGFGGTDSHAFWSSCRPRASRWANRGACAPRLSLATMTGTVTGRA
jgi:hypothetical protein